jgi:hypothetical protein
MENITVTDCDFTQTASGLNIKCPFHATTILLCLAFIVNSFKVNHSIVDSPLRFSTLTRLCLGSGTGGSAVFFQSLKLSPLFDEWTETQRILIVPLLNRRLMTLIENC